MLFNALNVWLRFLQNKSLSLDTYKCKSFKRHFVNNVKSKNNILKCKVLYFEIYLCCYQGVSKKKYNIKINNTSIYRAYYFLYE